MIYNWNKAAKINVIIILSFIQHLFVLDGPIRAVYSQVHGATKVESYLKTDEENKGRNKYILENKMQQIHYCRCPKRAMYLQIFTFFLDKLKD